MYSTVSKPWLAALAAGILCAACPLAAQQDPHQHHHHVALAETASVPAARLAIPDTPVLDQDGKSVRFYTDLVKGKVVAINFIFTTCTTICPPLAATFAHVQRLMGDRVGKDVHLISVSVDPVTDTPSRLKAWARKFSTKPGWTLVTGHKQDIDQLLKSLNAFTPDKQDHSPIVLIGNDPAGTWTRAYGLISAAKLAGLIDAAGNRQSAMQGEEAHQQ